MHQQHNQQWSCCFFIEALENAATFLADLTLVDLLLTIHHWDGEVWLDGSSF
jgi:hypothetical protein